MKPQIHAHTLNTYTSVGRHCIIYRFTLLFYDWETEERKEVQEANVKKAVRKMGYIKETAGIVDAGNRDIPEVWGEKKMKEDLTAAQLDRCWRKERKIYKARNGFQK